MTQNKRKPRATNAIVWMWRVIYPLPLRVCDCTAAARRGSGGGGGVNRGRPRSHTQGLLSGAALFSGELFTFPHDPSSPPGRPTHL